ncbi:MAG: hypothetical protein EXS49_01405 [Candidatus Pacebacteria bacterium]|nr:hypothetical protein [Candidatus Paceibacterota bacterium]
MDKIKNSKKKGIISLIVALILGAVIVEIGLNVAFLSFIISESNLGNRLTNEALSSARTGIDDGILKIIRGIDNAQYPLNIGSSLVNVTICGGSLCSPVINSNKDQITSVGLRALKKRKIIAIIEVDPVTRLVKVESIEEVPF